MISLKWHDTPHAEIVLRLDVESAEWMFDRLPLNDIATKELQAAIMQAKRRREDE